MPDDPPQRPTRARRADEVEDELRRMILEGRVQPGEQLLQIELSRQLGVSRTPLREAFRILEHEGLIRIANGNQTVEVARLSPEELVELYEVREMIDALAARKCAARGLDAPTRRHLDDLLVRMETASDPLDLAEYGKSHTEFHCHLVECSGNCRLATMLPLVRMTTMSTGLRYARQSLAGDEVLRESALHEMVKEANDHHRRIVEAIESGVEDQAEAVARLHIRRTILGIERMRIRATADRPAE
ncbi:MAG: GntR family transcriptional regulator [Acidimicrobiia bacterium]